MVSNLSEVKGEFENRLKGKVSRPMGQAGIYDPMEQVGHRDMVYLKSVLSIVDEMRKDYPTEQKAIAKAREWNHGNDPPINVVRSMFTDMVKDFRKRWFGKNAKENLDV